MNENDKPSGQANAESGSTNTSGQMNDSTFSMPKVQIEPQQTSPMANPAFAAQPTSFQTNVNKSETHTRNNKKLAIIVTLLIAFIAAGAVVYVYLSAQDNTSESTTKLTTESTETAETTAPANAQEVEATVNDIDETISSVDETTDFDSSGLSDEALQL